MCYLDNIMARFVLQDSAKRREVLKPTNPAAQRDALKSSQYKVSPRSTTKIKPKPLHSVIKGKVRRTFGKHQYWCPLGGCFSEMVRFEWQGLQNAHVCKCEETPLQTGNQVLMQLISGLQPTCYKEESLRILESVL